MAWEPWGAASGKSSRRLSLGRVFRMEKSKPPLLEQRLKTLELHFFLFRRGPLSEETGNMKGHLELMVVFERRVSLYCLLYQVLVT